MRMRRARKPTLGPGLPAVVRRRQHHSGGFYGQNGALNGKAGRVGPFVIRNPQNQRVL